MNSVGIPIDSASDLENPGRSSRTCPIRVVALSIKGCFISGGSRCQRPGPSSVSTKNFEPAFDIAGSDLVCRRREACQQRRGTALVVGVERGIELAAGLGQDQLAQQIGPPLRDAEGNMPAAGMAHEVDGPGVQLLDEGDDVVDMLRDRIGVADSVPLFGKEVPQADADQPVLLRQRPDHTAPDAEIVERTMHADQRRAALDWPTSR